MNVIDKAVEVSGGTQTILAELLSALPENTGKPIKQAHVSWWKLNGTPPFRCLQIEAVTNGQVTRYDLRPDIFGDKAA